MRRTTKTRKGPGAGVLIAVILVVATLAVAKRVLMPLALAVLFSFVLAPVVTRVQTVVRRRFPAVMIVVTFGLFVVLGIGWLVAAQAGELAQELPRYRQNIVQKVRAVRASLGGSMGPMSETISEISREIASQPASAPAAVPRPGTVPAEASAEEAEGPSAAPEDFFKALMNWSWREGSAGREPHPVSVLSPLPVTIESRENGMLNLIRPILGSLMGLMGNAALATVFVAFFLLEREELRDRLIRLVGRRHISVTTEALDDAARRVSRYLVVQVLLNAFNGLVITSGLLVLGVPGALLWGLMAAILRFVPFVGTWIAAAMPIMLALAVFDDWTRPLLVAALFLLTDTVIGSVLEPWLYGVRVGAAPLAILVSAVFWTWLWGGVGLFLATPLTVCLVVIARYAPQLEFLGVLLSDQPGLPPPQRLYQRLLAMDERGAKSLVHRALKTSPALEVYESWLIPTLREVERDRRAHDRDGHREAFMRRTLTALIQEVEGPSLPTAPDAPGAASAKAPPPADCGTGIVCVAARTWIDELSAQMLKQALGFEGFLVRAGPTRALPAEWIDRLEESSVHIVCICAMPGPSLDRARYLCERLHGTAPGVQIVAVIWSANGSLPDTNLAGDWTTARRVTRLSEAVQVVRELVMSARATRASECGPHDDSALVTT